MWILLLQKHWQGAEEQVIISISLEEREFLAIGDKLDIEMVDGTHTVHSVFFYEPVGFSKECHAWEAGCH